MDEPYAPIAVFDSGVGGLAVLRALRRLLPSEDLLYYADQANFPYGVRTAADVRALAVEAARHVLDQDAKLLVVACNTASSAALPDLRRRFSVPIVGIEPAVKPACALSRCGRVGVLATDGTVQGEALRQLIERVAGGVEVYCSHAGRLVELVEDGLDDAGEVELVLNEILAPVQAQGVDVVVLGCTHYVFLQPAVERLLGASITVLEPAEAVARQAARVLHEHGIATPSLKTGTTRYQSSAGEERLLRMMQALTPEVVSAYTGNPVQNLTSSVVSP
jgi:glutamate racemase